MFPTKARSSCTESMGGLAVVDRCYSRVPPRTGLLSPAYHAGSFNNAVVPALTVSAPGPTGCDPFSVISQKATGRPLISTCSLSCSRATVLDPQNNLSPWIPNSTRSGFVCAHRIEPDRTLIQITGVVRPGNNHSPDTLCCSHSDCRLQGLPGRRLHDYRGVYLSDPSHTAGMTDPSFSDGIVLHHGCRRCHNRLYVERFQLE